MPKTPHSSLNLSIVLSAGPLHPASAPLRSAGASPPAPLPFPDVSTEILRRALSEVTAESGGPPLFGGGKIAIDHGLTRDTHPETRSAGLANLLRRHSSLGCEAQYRRCVVGADADEHP